MAMGSNLMGSDPLTKGLTPLIPFPRRLLRRRRERSIRQFQTRSLRLGEAENAMHVPAMVRCVKQLAQERSPNRNSDSVAHTGVMKVSGGVAWRSAL